MTSVDLRTFLQTLSRWKGAKIDPRKIGHTFVWGLTTDGTPFPITNNTGVKGPQVLHKDHIPPGNGNAIVVVPDGETWNVVRVVTRAAMAADVLNRTPQVQFTPDLPGDITGVKLLQTSVITLSSSQIGFMILGEQPYHWTVDQGVLAKVADENPLPMKFKGGSIIGWVNSAANSAALDKFTMRVSYTLVGE